MENFSKQIICDAVEQLLFGKAQERALDLVRYFYDNGMSVVLVDLNVWNVMFKDEIVCSLWLFKGERKCYSLYVFMEGDYSHVYSKFPLEESVVKIALKHVNKCIECGGRCDDESCKTVFGQEYRNICGSPIKFVNPCGATMASVKKLLEMRKFSIFNKLVLT